MTTVIIVSSSSSSNSISSTGDVLETGELCRHCISTVYLAANCHSSTLPHNTTTAVIWKHSVHSIYATGLISTDDQIQVR